MNPAIVEEAIWHFAGYLHLPPDDLYTAKIIYEGGGSSGVGQDSEPGPARTSWVPSSNIAYVVGPYAPPRPADTLHFQLHRPMPQHLAAHYHYTVWHAGYLPDQPIPIDMGAIGGGEQLQITAIYQGGGQQELVDLQQVNMLVNDNHVNRHSPDRSRYESKFGLISVS